MKAAMWVAGIVLVIQGGIGAVAQSGAHDRERLVGAWRLVQIDPGGGHATVMAAQPEGMLIYTRDGHVSVQLMYPEGAHAPDNEYVRGGYEASFGSYDVDEAAHTVMHHVRGSITRDLLVGKNLPRAYRFTADGHLILRSTDSREHWSVTWERY